MISFEEMEKKFNFRVGAIIQTPDENKILIHRLSDFDFWLLPGGRVEMLESTEDAVKREMQEELGITSTETERLIATSETFFNMKDKIYHELGYNYLLKLPSESPLFSMKGEFAGIEGEKYRYKWYDKAELGQINFKPEFLVPILQDLPKQQVHIIKDETVKKNKNLKDNK